MRTLSIASAALLLAACGSQGPVADGAADASGFSEQETAPPDEITGQGDAEAGSSATPSAAVSQASVPIPQKLRGRWSHDPAGCDANAPSAGSLMVVTGQGLRFEGSTAMPAGDIHTSTDTISGEFSFSDGTKSWTRFQSLELRGGQLIRTQGGPIESYTYIRCDG